MKPGYSNFVPADSVYPHKGLNTFDPSTLCEAGYSPDCSDVTFTDGELSKRKGYLQLGNVPDANPVMAIIPFQTSSGTQFTVRVTTSKQSYYDDATNTWIDITTADTWNGGETDLVSWVVVAGVDVGGKVLIITNGKNRPQIWDGVAALFKNAVAAPYSWNYPALASCKWLASMNNHLIMGNINGNVQNVAWTDAGKVNEWIAGTAAEEVLYDTIGAIKAIIPLAGRLIVYADDSLHTMSYVGGDLIYIFERVLDNIRLVSPNAIVDLGPYHIFLSQDNIQLFDGSRTTPTAANAIHRTYRDELSQTYAYRAFGFLDRSRKRVYFAVPTSSTISKIYLLEYNLSGDLSVQRQQSWTWAPQLTNDRLQAMGFYTKQSELHWNSLSIASLTWSGASGPWNAGSAKKGFPSRVVGDAVGKIYLADDTSSNDNTVAIQSHWDSKDFTLPQEYQSENARFIEIELEMKGNAVDVYYSVDMGGSYTLAASGKILTQAHTTYRLPIDAVGRSIRVRLANNYPGSSFTLKWLRVWFTTAGPY